MPVVVLRGPVAYKYKGILHQRDIPSPDLSPADAAHLVRTGKFVYVGDKLPEQKADEENHARRTRKMSDVLGASKAKGSDLTTKDLKPADKAPVAKEEKKKAGRPKKEEKVRKTADVDAGLPVFDTVQELADWAFEEHGILVSEGSYAEAVQQIQAGIAANKEPAVTV